MYTLPRQRFRYAALVAAHASLDLTAEVLRQVKMHTPLFRLYYGSILAIFWLYFGSIKAVCIKAVLALLRGGRCGRWKTCWKWTHPRQPCCFRGRARRER